MKHLVYAIRRHAAVEPSPLPRGLDGNPISLLGEGEIAVAYSKLDVPAQPAVPQLLAYARVIEELWRIDDVLPLRYGCVLDTEAEMRGLLRRRRQSFVSSLEEVKGCVEMGLRVLLAGADMPVYALPRPSTTGGRPDAESEATSPEKALPVHPSGAAYLARRKVYFAQKDSCLTETTTVSADIRAAFADLVEKCLEEPTAGRQAPMLSLSFLLRREKVDRLREVFLQFQKTCVYKLLLTGPWPPYSFAAGQDGSCVACP